MAWAQWKEGNEGQVPARAACWWVGETESLVRTSSHLEGR